MYTSSYTLKLVDTNLMLPLQVKGNNCLWCRTHRTCRAGEDMGPPLGKGPQEGPVLTVQEGASGRPVSDSSWRGGHVPELSPGLLHGPAQSLGDQ